MPILDLAGAAPLFPKPQATVKRSRTLTGASLPAGYATGASPAGGFAAARVTRLSLDFLGRNVSADQDLFSDNRLLRARARDLSINNPFGRKFIQMVRQNVVGEAGPLVKSKVTNASGKETAETDRINLRIDQEWTRWCKRGRCTADGKLSFVELLHQLVGTVACEGESLVKFVYGRQFNDCGFALQSLDPDQLDDTMMQRAQDGSGAEIRMGVEVDRYGRPRAYHLFNAHPSDVLGGGRERTRVPAEFINHFAMWNRAGQTRGYTWMSAAIMPLNQYGRYSEAVVVAARASAAKFGVIETAPDAGDAFTGGEDEDGQGLDTNADGTGYLSGDTGSVQKLDPGEKFIWTDPRFPTNTHKDFTQTQLREIASGFCVMYPSLANDLEGVNFSSIRAGMVDERDMWRIIQRGVAEGIVGPIRMAWLRMALLTVLSDVTLTPVQMEQFTVRGRGWDWVDPKNDADASLLEMGSGMTTLERECAEKGRDWQEELLQLKREQDFVKSLGVVIGVDLQGDQGGKGVAPGDEAQAAKAAGGAGKGGK